MSGLDPKVIEVAFARAVEAASEAQRKALLLDEIVAPAIAVFIGWMRTTPGGMAWLEDQSLKATLDRLGVGEPVMEPPPAKPAPMRSPRRGKGAPAHG
jgi:hypothetical protein